MIHRAIRFLGLLLLIASTLNCGGGGSTAAAPTITALTFSGTTTVGSTITLVSKVTDPAGLALTYSWDFGDGQTGNRSIATTHAYSSEGTYTVTLRATNSGGSSVTKTVTVIISGAPPVISSATASTGANIGSTVSFTGIATDPKGLPLTYTWKFGDGLASDTGSNVFRIFNAATTYNVTLTVTNTSDLSDSRTLSVNVGSIVLTNPISDCSGLNCSASSSANTNTYTGTGTGIWRFDNLTNAAVTRDINIQNVKAGKTVTLLFSNGQTSSTAATIPILGALAAPAGVLAAPSAIAAQSMDTLQASEHEAGEAHHTQILQANRALALDMIRSASSAPKTAPLGIAALPDTFSSPAPSPVVLGDVRDWNENSFKFQNYSTTAKVVCPAGTLGRKVVMWVQTSLYMPASSSFTSYVTDAKLALYKSQFCDTNNNDGQYTKIAKLLGDVWGPVPATFISGQIADSVSQKQDINIVIIDPDTTTWGGYFYSLNNGLKTRSEKYANSNEALVFFVSSRLDQNYTASVLIHELTHMINYYQRTVLHWDIHDTWLEETSAMMTQDIFDPGFTTPNGCLPIVCDVRGYATSGAAVSYFKWPDWRDSASVRTHYRLGGSFGAFLNRRYGPLIYLQLMTDCYTPTTNTTSIACLDFLIKKNGGVSFADDFAKMGASVFGRIGGTAEPSQYGFPAKNGTVTAVGNLIGSYTYALPAFNNWWWSSLNPLPTATRLTTYPYTSQTYQIDTVTGGKTSYVRTGVSVPAKTSLIIIVK